MIYKQYFVQVSLH